MKTMKYRSIFAAFTAVALSVFLFTSCEKESDGEAERGNRLEKFKRLQFSTGSASSSTNSGSGTFIGNGSNISYVPPGSAGSAQFAPAPSGNANGFTNPNSTGPNFVVDRSFGEGGGSVTVDGERFDMDYAFCAEADFLGFFEDEGDSTSSGNGDGPELNLFVGIAGEFTTEGEGDPMMDLVLYAFSYNGGQAIGSFEDFEGDLGKRFKGAFVIAVAFEEGEQGSTEATFYFGTEGSVAFSGSEVIMSGVKMTKVETDSENGGLTGDVVNLAANLTCVEAPVEEE